ncbi:putative photosynthetic complex assembly protein PuhE [Nevskia sp.]|uniref:putative photosynthetic complex assembly protein PuhE n=1 Tax=Nevskia sp. TaxID=1929292 RepID=UPI0025E0A8F6|nr:putative photosynthetic complex assembly protein PuhE [Nevskia sp.]
MSSIAYPVAFTLFLWWFSTGAILYLDGLPRHTFRWSLLAATGVLAGALVCLAQASAETTATSAYAAFTCGILVWGWLEMSFLMGFITGPRRTPCPPASRGLLRMRHAIEAILYHELALIGGAVLIATSTWGNPNQLGLWTYAVLWILRTSAKLNVFLGVRNLSEEFLPDHLRYLQTYFTRKPMNLLFPVSVTVATIAAIRLWQAALAPGAGEFDAAALSFVATLLTLAVLEHWFLVVPIPANLLWQWGLASRKPDVTGSTRSGAASLS